MGIAFTNNRNRRGCLITSQKNPHIDKNIKMAPTDWINNIFCKKNHYSFAPTIFKGPCTVERLFSVPPTLIFIVQKISLKSIFKTLKSIYYSVLFTILWLRNHSTASKSKNSWKRCTINLVKCIKHYPWGEIYEPSKFFIK